MPASLELVLDLGKLGPHTLRDGLALEPELSGPGLPADVREAKEIERLWLPIASGSPIPGGMPPELDEPRLVGMQFQPELRKPLTKVGEKLPCVTLILESGHKVIGSCRVPDYAED
jgi:hypothetical protein